MTHRELPEWPERSADYSLPSETAIYYASQSKAVLARLRVAVGVLRELSMHHLNAHDMTFKASGALDRIGALPPEEEK